MTLYFPREMQIHSNIWKVIVSQNSTSCLFLLLHRWPNAIQTEKNLFHCTRCPQEGPCTTCGLGLSCTYFKIMSFSLFQIMDTPLKQQWNVDLYGRITFSVQFKMKGQSVKLLLQGKQSLGYSSFGGR